MNQSSSVYFFLQSDGPSGYTMSKKYTRILQPWYVNRQEDMTFGRYSQFSLTCKMYPILNKHVSNEVMMPLDLACVGT